MIKDYGIFWNKVVTKNTHSDRCAYLHVREAMGVKSSTDSVMIQWDVVTGIVVKTVAITEQSL